VAPALHHPVQDQMAVIQHSARSHQRAAVAAVAARDQVKLAQMVDQVVAVDMEAV
jgi:hypothetical protein